MTGIILFRAQPFHNGHLEQIRRAVADMRKLNSRLYIIVGSADKCGTRRNPFHIDLRIRLIENSLIEEFDVDYEKYITVVPLEDLSDEANNTFSWGEYLYNHLCEITNDKDFIIYYSDKPEIMLSWFDDTLKPYIAYKFLPRYNDISATKIREYLTLFDDEHLKEAVPKYVFNNRKILRECLYDIK